MPAPSPTAASLPRPQLRCPCPPSPAQLWLLAEWVCSEGGRPVRKPLAGELVRLIDATITAAVRQQIEQRSGSAALAARLAPSQPEEALSAERARLLWAVLTSRAGQAVPMPQLSAGLFGLPGERGRGCGAVCGRRCATASVWLPQPRHAHHLSIARGEQRTLLPTAAACPSLPCVLCVHLSAQRATCFKQASIPQDLPYPLQLHSHTA